MFQRLDILLEMFYKTEDLLALLLHCIFLSILPFDFSSSLLLSLWSIKEPGIQTLIRSLFWDAAAAAKSLQSCPTLCDPRDGSPPGSAVPGILQARTLEWVSLPFSRSACSQIKVSSLPRHLASLIHWPILRRAEWAWTQYQALQKNSWKDVRWGSVIFGCISISNGNQKQKLSTASQSPQNGFQVWQPCFLLLYLFVVFFSDCMGGRRGAGGRAGCLSWSHTALTRK